MDSRDEIRRALDGLRSRLGARAAGAWLASGGRLDQLAFAPAPDLPAGVADGFASATRSVDLVRLELGIVRAATTGVVVASIASELPAGVGSGYWLRAFGADRSVAVPILGPAGEVALIVSVALGLDHPVEVVALTIREAVRARSSSGIATGLDGTGAGRDN